MREPGAGSQPRPRVAVSPDLPAGIDRALSQERLEVVRGDPTPEARVWMCSPAAFAAGLQADPGLRDREALRILLVGEAVPPDALPLVLQTRVDALLSPDGAPEALREAVRAAVRSAVRQDLPRVRDELRETVWAMNHAADLPELLAALKRAVDDLELPVSNASVNIVPPGGGRPRRVPTYRTASPGDWQQSELDDERAELVHSWWRRQAPVYYRDLLREDPDALRELICTTYQQRVRSVVNVPFSHGVFGVNSVEPEAFDDQDLEILQALAEALNEGFRHLDNLNELATSARRYRALVEAVPHPVLLLDWEEKCVYASARLAELGWSQPQATQTTGFLSERAHPRDREDLLTALNRARILEEPQTCECRLRDGNGRWRDIAVHATQLPEEGDDLLVQVVLQDLTGALQAERQRARALLRERVRNAVLEIQDPKAGYFGILQVMERELGRFRLPVERLGAYVVDIGAGVVHAEELEPRRLCRRWEADCNAEEVRPIVEAWRASRVPQSVAEDGVSGSGVIRLPFRHGALELYPVAGDWELHRGVGAIVRDLGDLLDLAWRRLEDLSQRRAIDAQLNLLRNVVEQSPLSVVITDLDGAIRYVNPAFSHVTGYTEEEVAGQNPRLLKSGAQPDDYYVELWETILRGEVWRGQMQNRRKDGSLFWERASISPVRDEQGQVSAFVALKQDITHTKRQEAERQAVDQIRQQVLAMKSDGDVRRVVSTMNTVLQALQIPVYRWGVNLPQRREGRTVITTIGPSGEVLREIRTPRNLAALERIQREGRPVYRPDLDAADPWDEAPGIRSVHPTVRCVLDIPFAFGTLALNSEIPDAFSETDRIFLQRVTQVMEEGFRRAHDLDELRRANAELRDEVRQRVEAEEALLRSSRLIALGEMSAGMAHELNQPLTVISALAEGLDLRLEAGRTVDVAQQREWSDDILQQVDRMRRLIEHLRLFSREESEPVRVAVDLHAVLDSALAMCGTQMRAHGIEVANDIATELPTVTGDPYRLEEVFLNLLSNARDALDEHEAAGGGGDGWQKRIRLSASPRDGGVGIQVADTGPGIGDADRLRIFDPFFTTKDPDKGTGLGLSIAYAIVRQHEGRLDVDSVPGEGSTFRVWLPASGSGAAAAAAD